MTLTNQQEKFSRAEVLQQNGKDGKPIWIIYRKGVYDVTNYLEKHPGGAKIIREYAGRDCTRDFDDMGHSIEALGVLKVLKVGEVDEDNKVKSKITQSASFVSITSSDSERKKKRRFLMCR